MPTIRYFLNSLRNALNSGLTKNNIKYRNIRTYIVAVNTCLHKHTYVHVHTYILHKHTYVRSVHSIHIVLMFETNSFRISASLSNSEAYTKSLSESFSESNSTAARPWETHAFNRGIQYIHTYIALTEICNNARSNVTMAVEQLPYIYVYTYT